ncbi:unnamed protein product [Cyclocybe aegerita]|uniref:Uncharacterized protein n=1 Tax=Cyclocybe aegerita TaxID=1973307 RepID=A0A8S0XQW4_CYCAE|nr:unnamed protein product [Cyclocybe aegerita]
MPSRETDARAVVLQNVDLLSIVFNYLSADRIKSDQDALETRKGLRSAALVCKDFVEPALDCLWHILPSLMPLLKLLPSFGLIDGVYMLEDVEEGDWERYDIHARRVRILDLKPDQVSSSPFVYPRIMRHRKGPLLPALRELRIPDNTSIDLTLAFIVTTPDLKVVEIKNSAMKDAKFSYPFLTSLSSEHPKLEHLTIDGDRVINLKPILKLTHLRKLELRLPNMHLSTSFMEGLGNMENLLDLTLHAGVQTQVSIPEPVRRDPLPRLPPNTTRKFKQLKHLHVLGTISCIARVMEYMNPRSLLSFSLTESRDSSGNPLRPFWTQCFGCLASSEKLASITINHCSQGKKEDYLSASSLEPLFDLSGMQHLMIHGDSFTATDSELLALACAFPRLKSLVLPSGWHTSAPTPKSLCHLALSCPELEELRICLNVDQNLANTVKSMTDDVAEMPLKHKHSLRRLYINSSLGNLSNSQSIVFARVLWIRHSLSSRFFDIRWSCQ